MIAEYRHVVDCPVDVDISVTMIVPVWGLAEATLALAKPETPNANAATAANTVG